MPDSEEEKEEEEQILTEVDSTPQVVNQDPPPKKVNQDLLNRTFVPKAPFPHRLKDNKKGNHEEILEVFKQVQINIPLLDAIKQVPSYAKFLKDLVTQKRKTNVPKKAFLAEQASSIIQCKIPVKYKDPGCPTISCILGDHHIERALVDLGASVNLLPYSVYVQLHLGELKPTPMTIQLADRSVKIPRGVIEDVLIKVDTFYFPVDFVVLDTEPVQNIRGQIPVILGRPFLATSNALINCRNGVMKISFGNLTAELNIFDVTKASRDCDDDVRQINLIDSLVEDRILETDDNFPLREDVNFSDISLENFLNTLDPSDDNVSSEASVFLDSLLDVDSTEWEEKIDNFLNNDPSDVAKNEKSMVLDPKSLHDTELSLMIDTKLISYKSQDGNEYINLFPIPLENFERNFEYSNFDSSSFEPDLNDQFLDAYNPFERDSNFFLLAQDPWPPPSEYFSNRVGKVDRVMFYYGTFSILKQNLYFESYPIHDLSELNSYIYFDFILKLMVIYMFYWDDPQLFRLLIYEKFECRLC